MLMDKKLLAHNVILRGRVLALKNALGSEKEKSSEYKRQKEAHHDCGDRACLLIHELLKFIKMGKDEFLGECAIQAHVDIVAGFMADRLALIVDNSVSDLPGLKPLNASDVRKLALDIVERTNPTALPLKNRYKNPHT